MTNYEKIKFLLDMWVYKGVEVKTPIRRYFFTKIDDSFKETYSLYLSKITSITPIPNPPKLLTVGTKVRVFEEYGLKDKIYSVAYIKKIETGMEKEISFDVWYVLVWWHEIPARAVVPVL